MEPVSTPAGQSPRWALAALSLTMLMPSLATSAANVALPNLARAFAASFQAAQWIVLSYLLTITALIVAVGRLGDILGRRRLLLMGTAIFAAGSLFSGMAPTLEILIFARVVQGLGAAIMMALTMAFVGEVVPPERAGTAMGLLGTMSAVGTTLGPALGGLLIACAGTRAIFLINVPLAVLGSLIASQTLPKDPPREEGQTSRIDVAGMVLLAAALTAYALAMTIGRGQFGLLNLALLVVAIALGSAFVAIEARLSMPLVRLDLFRDRAIASGLATSFFVSTVMMSTLVVGPFYLAKVIGLGPVGAGFMLAVGPLVAAFFGIPAGRLVDRFGAAHVALAGLIALAAGTFALSQVQASIGLAGYLVPIICITSGYSLFQTANNAAILTAAAKSEQGIVSGLLNLSRNLGLVTGASAMGAVFAWGTAARDVVTASPQAITVGMHTTFAVAAFLIGTSLLISFRAARGGRGRQALVTC